MNLGSNLVLPVYFAAMHFQIPREVPHPNNNSPIDLSKPEDVVIYIILPLVFIVLYFVGRIKKRK